MKGVSRRQALTAIAGAGLVAGCRSNDPTADSAVEVPSAGLSPIRMVTPLGSPPWDTSDPFLFCVHHLDEYPKGTSAFGPQASLAGRNIGSDFAGKDGWRMYHGDVVPGFPRHPHRGFETVTVVRRGLLDHADSLGAAARYGHGDVQWLTAGRGIQHAEMFPLLNQDKDNPLELFQIWLNLPKTNKMVEPAFSMLWADTIPHLRVTDPTGNRIDITIHAGALGALVAPKPPPSSYASMPGSDVGIWSIKLSPGASYTVPAANAGTVRNFYYFDGAELTMADQVVARGNRVEVDGSASVPIKNGNTASELLMLQGKPIGEAVARRGPFVMNSPDEIRQAYADFQRTQFGGWPWDRNDPVHGDEPKRFARHANGRIDQPG